VRLLGYDISLTKSVPLRSLNPSTSGWWPWGVIRESFTGAWQTNVEIRADTALSYYAVYACLRLVTTDVAKCCLRLVEKDGDGVWNETESPAFSPLLREPNRFQTINKFVEHWILSKLMYGNTYVLLERDLRRVVTAMYVLDPSRVKPLVANDGAVYYEVKRDDLSGLTEETEVFPASEIIHDTYIAPFHPLIGLSPIYACGLAATQGLSIQNNSKNFFTQGSNPSGMLSAPGAISDETAARLKAHFDGGAYSGNNAGRVIVAGDGLQFKQFTMTALDAQLIEQLRMTAEQVCSSFGVPPYLVDIGPAPPYANFEPLLLKYHSQCIQSLMTNFEKHLDKGLGMVDKIEGRQLGTEFDIDDLIWMDTATKTEAAQKSSGTLSPNEARKRYFGVGPVTGGESPLAQQQYYSLEALSKRDAAPPTDTPPQPEPAPRPEMDEAAEATDLRLKAYQRGLLMAAA
jgi:HK97 family phage portal protein